MSVWGTSPNASSKYVAILVYSYVGWHLTRLEGGGGGGGGTEEEHASREREREREVTGIDCR